MIKSNSDLLGNSVWNVSSFVVAVALNLLVLPFVLVRLGARPFGVASLVVACTAPALAFSSALALSTTRELATRLDRSERVHARHIFGTALFLALAGGAAIATILALIGPALARTLFHIGDIKDLGLAFLLAAGGWLCQCVATAFVALFTARQDYARVAAISVVGVVVSTGSILILVPLRTQVSTYVGCQALGFAATLAASYAFALRRHREWVVRPVPHATALHRLARLGGWQFLAQGCGVISVQADRYLLGAFLAPNYVGYYTIAQRLGEAIYMGVLKVGEILFPFFSSIQNDSTGRLTDLLFRSSWVMNAVGASALGGLIPVTGLLLKAWAGAEVAVEAQELLVVLAVAGILGCTGNVFNYFLLASGRSRDVASISIATALATIGTSSIVLPLFGWKAAGLSACAGMSAQFAASLTVLRKTIRASDLGARIIHLVLQPLATGIVASIGLRYLLRGLLVDLPANWWSAGIAYAVSAALVFLSIVAVSMIGPYRRTCWQDLIVLARHVLPREAL